MNRTFHIGVLGAPLVLAACVSIPSGPSIVSFPGAGKPFDQFQNDELECRRYASTSVNGSDPAQAQADSAVKSAALGTAVGALGGAALGGHQGAASGAGIGLLFGALAGSETANASAYAVQHRYDNAYMQCMYSKGNTVPAATPRVAARRYYAPASPPLGYYDAPPPPPYPSSR